MENELLKKYMDGKSEVDTLLEKYLSMDESRKSQFVAKLIGLGVLVKDKDGKLKPGKNKMSKEEVLKHLSKGKK